MAEFVMKSRKNEKKTPDFELEKLEKPDEKQLFELFESKVEDVRPERIADTVPRLPRKLEALVRAAGSNVLPETVMLSSGLVPDLNRYVLGCVGRYVVGDHDEALRCLWQAHCAWQGVN